ncbi:sporulation integral membrane protein YlbJ [Desulfonispora thiosulfatigenes DSM 11270]|uniref:Sporulation integral membrane protein YlbJ n=1 Tax=Desulfonispora thiosulfatigenes DSM 11270 TaxID=656914 RepID=A0A1W1VJL6_DESTI|nr:sporulation integral membrane protein YlbJ [Desulfonispora thiosulfatigenes]SMB93569.1 sporulation integral membrane protein YlbJ [Desulfonispora thiosulfatigenes DSM 11270]
MKKNYILRFIISLFTLYLVISMILHPEETFNGAGFGLKTWSTVLIPSLLPFFIITDLMVELGIVRLLGVLLENIMRPLFKQPGEAGFVLAMGLTSGFPMGAVLTNQLLENDVCTKEEATRLICFTNNASPVFLLVAIPIGMFNNPSLGILLAICHYGANIILGITLGIFSSKSNYLNVSKNSSFTSKIHSAISSLIKNKKPLGIILGNAVNKSIKNILLIGGFVVFFSVFLEILKNSSLFVVLQIVLGKGLMFLGLDSSFSQAITTGFFEMTLGAKTAAETNAPLIEQLIIVSFILGWSGLSIQAQVTSIVGKMDIPISKYIFSRLLHGVISCFLINLLYDPVLKIMDSNLPVFNMPFTQVNYHTLGYLKFNLVFALLALVTLIFISFVLTLAKKNKQV